MGPSGSGKSTLLHCLAALEPPTTGKVFLGETDITRLGHRERAWLRRDRLGFIFQAFNLVPTLDARENITLPQRLAGSAPDAAWVRTVIDQVGLGDRLHHRPAELSGGQQQRVAIARALAGRPEIIFADEPTGNLDTRAGHEVLSLLRAAVDQHGQTIVMVTHDPMAAAYADRVVFLGDGCLVDELRDPTADRVLERLKSMGGFLPGVVRGSTGPLRAPTNTREDGQRGSGQPGGQSSPDREQKSRAGARLSRHGEQSPFERNQPMRDDEVEERLLEQVHALWDQPDERVLDFVRAAFRDTEQQQPKTDRQTPVVARAAGRRPPPPSAEPPPPAEPRLVRRQRPSMRDIGRPTWRRSRPALPASTQPRQERQAETPEIMPAPPLPVRPYRPAPSTRAENGASNGNGRQPAARRGEEPTVWRGPVPPPTLEPSAWRREPSEAPASEDRSADERSAPGVEGSRKAADVSRLPGRQARREWRADTLEELKRRARERVYGADTDPPAKRNAPRLPDDGFLPPMAGATEPPATEERRNDTSREVSETAAQLLAKVLERVQNGHVTERNGHHPSGRRER